MASTAVSLALWHFPEEGIKKLSRNTSKFRKMVSTEKGIKILSRNNTLNF
jgi:hypothetical protein